MELVNKLQHQEKLATEIRRISNLYTLAEKWILKNCMKNIVKKETNL